MRTMYQLAAKLAPREDQDIEEIWTKVVRSVVGWVRGRSAAELPQEAWDGADFECGVPGHLVECVTIPSEGIWSLRLTHPDAPHGGHAAVPGRTWTTEVALKRGAVGPHLLGIRLFCTSQPFCKAEVISTRPGIVQTLADRFVISSLRHLDARPWYLHTEADLDEFYDFIVAPQRVLPVYLLTEADGMKLPGKVCRYVLDERRLAGETLGLAHVAVLPHSMSFEWTGRVSKVWSAFQGAVRTYRPGLDFEADSPFTDHPLALAENIIFTRCKGKEGEEAFTAFLTDRSYQESATRAVDWNGCLFFTDAKRRRAEIIRQQATEDADWQAIYQEEIVVLQQKIAETEEERDAMIDLIDQADKDRDCYIAENNSLRWQIDLLRARLTEKTGDSPDTSIEIPSSYEDLPDWVDRNLAGRLVLHPRAIHAVGAACYENVELVYRSLLFLANEYRGMRLNHDGAREAYQRRIEAMKIECSPSISRERAGEQGDAYFVQYPSHTANRRFLESHIRKGTNREERYCLAIYFFWDEETRQVIVGWLPSHLNNRLT